MKIDAKQIAAIRKDIAEMAQAKRERIAHFKNGGTIKDLKPKYKHVARPF